MKQFVSKYLMISCKAATFNLGLKEAGKLSMAGKIRLQVHLAICKYCRRFEKQTAIIKNECKHLHSKETLPALAEEKLRQLLKEN